MKTPRRHRMIAAPAALAVGLSLIVAGTTLYPAQAESLRTYPLDKGHIDLFEVTYDEAAGGLKLSVKDDTYLHATGTVYRDPAEVSVVVDSDAAATDMTGAPPALDFLKVDGDTVYQLPQTQDQNLPWPGWSTERLVGTLPGGTELPASGQPVQLEVEVDGPGNVFTWQTGAFGAVTNRYVDTVDPAADVIPISRNAHVHTNWAFTQPGDYLLTVTPTASTTGGATLTGASATYHVYVGDTAVERTLRIEGLAAHYHQGGSIDLTLVAEPELSAGDEVTWEWRWPAATAWTAIHDASEATHRMTAEQALDGVQVRATVASADDTVTSTPVTVDIDDHGAAARQQPTITGPDTVAAGDAVTLTRVLPANGPTLLTEHRWERRATAADAWEVVAGETGETLAFTATADSAGTQYRVSLIKPDGELAYGPSPVHTLGEQEETPEPEPAPELGELADEYELTLLAPTNDGVTANALGINDEGDVVGITRPTSSAQPQRTVLWEGHGDHFHAHELANFDGSAFSRGFDLNDDQQIVGEAFNASGTSVPIRWTGTNAPQSVTLNEAGTGILNDINDDGVAVGTASSKAVRVAADGTVSVLTDPAPEGATLNNYSASTVADGDVIGGRTSLKLAGDTGNTLHGVVWDGDGPRLLTTPTGGSGPVVAGVIPDGSAVGSATVGSTETAVFWKASGAPYLLEAPGVADYTHTAAKAAADGVVVGYTSKFAGNTSFGGAAVGWDADGAVDLNTRVVDLPAGVTLLSAADVNEAGQIVGSATTADGARGFVLTPAAEELRIEGLSGHYHSGGAINLTALGGDPDGHYRWSMQRADQGDFRVVAGESGASVSLTAEQALHGARIKVESLIDGEVVMAAEPVTVEVDDHGAPAPQTVTIAGGSAYDEGEEVRLAADVAPTTVLDTYQWFIKARGAEAATPIPGATGASYAFTAAAKHDGAELTVAVVGQDGAVIYGPSAAHHMTVRTRDAGPVVKVKPKLKVVTKKKVRAGKKAVVKITVAAPGVRPTGKVTVKVAGKTKTVKLNARGKAKVKIKVKKKTKAGVKKVKVTYRGDARVTTGKNTATKIRVTR